MATSTAGRIDLRVYAVDVMKDFGEETGTSWALSSGVVAGRASVAPWSAVRNAAHSYGFASFSLDPGSGCDDYTTITVTCYDVVGNDGELSPFETLCCAAPRRD